MVPMTEYVVVSSLPEALRVFSAAAAAGESATPASGFTDIYPGETSRHAWFQSGRNLHVDISGIAELSKIVVGPGEVTFGARTTWTELAQVALPGAFHGLQTAARQVGGRQIQNRGTLAGNICNASPAADGVPPLLALDAEVELASVQGTRRMRLAEFVLGNRKTALRPDELLTRIHVPRPEPDEASVFIKLGARSYLVISIASVAANIRLGSDGRVARARIAVGACSAVPVRLTRIERELVGTVPDGFRASLRPEDGLTPIDDVRGSGAYRSRAAEVLVERAVQACMVAAIKAIRP